MSGLEFSVKWRPEAAQTQHQVESDCDEATLGELRISVDETSLTAVRTDRGVRHDGPNVPAYRLAEWLVWYWWRLLWGGAGDSVARSQAHDMARIGGGWLWPNIVVASDGYRVMLHARASASTSIKPLSHLANAACFVTPWEFERAADAFVLHVADHLAERNVGDRHLAQMHHELADERQDQDVRLRRQIEARLGCDPDEGDPAVIQQVICSCNDLGLDAMVEAVAERPWSAEDVRQVAKRHGIPTNPGDGAPPNRQVLWDGTGRYAPWRVGVAAAQDLRSRQDMGGDPVGDHMLAEVLGAPLQTVQGRRQHNSMAFSLKSGDCSHAVVLNTARRTGRRFALARLLGDRMLVDSNDRLRPATRAYTYRQKMQRAFAAEFLCPFASLKDEMAGDYSGESMEDAAKCFGVSTWLVHAQLANHGLAGSTRPDASGDSVVLAA